MSEITGVGFYESLNKFFVGFLILVLFVGLDSELFANPLFLISAYIVGCICQALVQRITKRWLTLKEDEIKEDHEEEYKNKKESCRNNIFEFMKEFLWPLYLIYRLSKFIDRLYKFRYRLFKYHKEGDSSSKEKGSFTFMRKLLCLIYRYLFCNRKRDKFSIDKEAYLKAYYKVAKAGLLMNIPVLEALENFMRNLIFIIPFYALFFIRDENRNAIFCKTYPLLEELSPSLWGDSNSTCIYTTLFSVFLMWVYLGVVWLRRYYQQTIYRLVWQGNKFLDKIDKDSKLEERKIRREMLKNRHFFFFRCKTRL